LHFMCNFLSTFAAGLRRGVRNQKKKNRKKTIRGGSSGGWKSAGSAPVCWQNTVHLIASNKCRLMLLSPDIFLRFSFFLSLYFGTKAGTAMHRRWSCLSLPEMKDTSIWMPA